MIKLVVTDLDNTIYNWVDYFVPAFEAMLQKMVRLTRLDERTLKGAFKRVYQRHGTTEYSFAIEELDVLPESRSDVPIREVLAKYDSAIKAFQRVRRSSLRLYDGVVPTLVELRRLGKIIAAHTDAMMYYAEARLKQLKVEHLFHALVAPKDHGIPKRAQLADLRSLKDPEKYKAQVPLKRALDPQIVKPNPECLRNIMRTFGVSPRETTYVGDNLHKDIYMARQCGVLSVYAEYGRKYDPENYRKLVEISHRTEADIKRERELSSVEVGPDFTISSFSELLTVIREIEKRVDR